MAITTVREASPEAKTAEPGASRPKGRDRLPDVPGLNLSPESFFGYLKSLSEKNWEHCLVYIYRQFPVLLARRPKYIEKVSRAFDESYLLNEHGSGDYYFTLNDTDIKGSQQTICQVQKMRPLRLRDDERPPKLNVAELDLNDPANANYIKKLIGEGKLTPTGEIPAQPSSGATEAELARTLRDTLQVLLKDKLDSRRGEPGEAQAYQRMMDMLSKANDQSIAMVLSQVKAQDPSHFISMLGALKELMPAGTSGDRLVEQLLRENAEGRKENRELLMKLLELKSQPPAAAPTLLEQIEQFKLMKEVMSDAPAAGKAASIWAELLPPLAPYIPATLGMLSNIAMGIFTRGPKANPGGTPPASTGPHPVDVGPAEIQAGQSAGQPGEPMQTDQMVAQLAGFLPIIQATLMKYINEGRTGADFADWIADSFGEVSYATLQRLSKEQILQALQTSPALNQILQAMPDQMGRFIDEFLNPALVPDETVDEPTEAPTKKKKKSDGPAA